MIPGKCSCLAGTGRGRAGRGWTTEEISDPLYLLELDPDPPLAFGPGLEVVDYGRTSPENECPPASDAASQEYRLAAEMPSRAAASWVVSSRSIVPIPRLWSAFDLPTSIVSMDHGIRGQSSPTMTFDQPTGGRSHQNRTVRSYGDLFEQNQRLPCGTEIWP